MQRREWISSWLKNKTIRVSFKKRTPVMNHRRPFRLLRFLCQAYLKTPEAKGIQKPRESVSQGNPEAPKTAANAVD
jgi:hypothetical protein